LERGKHRLSALKRVGEIVRFACPTELGKKFAFFLVFKGEEIRAFHLKNVMLKEI
ncbi:hypothetical protein T11_452, partial [Trichinella zimbabwensis]